MIKKTHEISKSLTVKTAFPIHNLHNLHIPVTPSDQQKMLNRISQGLKVDTFVKEVTGQIPKSIKSDKETPNMNKVLKDFASTMQRHKKERVFIGQGFYNNTLPPIIKRCVFENPLWYTAYTPYQAEISQGRLEAMFNYQIMVKRITRMEVANASLLDEASSAVEAALMAFRIHDHKRKTLFVADSVFSSTRQAVRAAVNELGIRVIEVDRLDSALIEEHGDQLIGFIAQSPDLFGTLHNYSQEADMLHKAGAVLIVGTDLLSCLLAKTPGDMNADIAFGNCQSFGTPVGFGGPHAAFFATKSAHIRRMPGRVISACRDVNGGLAFRMALQTREQHIRRELATSNICTSQALLAKMNFFFALYHGESGLLELAQTIRKTALTFGDFLARNDVEVVGSISKGHTGDIFNTVSFRLDSHSDEINETLASEGLYVHRINKDTFSVSFDENNCEHAFDLAKTIVKMTSRGKSIDPKKSKFSELWKSSATKSDESGHLVDRLRRSEERIFRETDIFNQVNGEHEMLRYITKLQNKDISLCHSMISLGSCTMKLNSAWEMEGVSVPGINVHPYMPSKATGGYLSILSELAQDLCQLTGMDGITFQSNSGAMGEYVGLKCIKQYHESRNEGHRNIVVIPASAHGTNPASATKMGLRVVVIKVDQNGYLDERDLDEKLALHKGEVFGMMLTYPSTHGVFEEDTGRIIAKVHDCGGKVYIDGANMNAQLGITSPGEVGGDVCHLNLHKTFCIPHGGGGPGMGPVSVKEDLVEFLPKHDKFEKCNFNSKGERVETTGDQILSTPFGSASILAIPYLYIKGMAPKGLQDCGIQALLSANYLAARLKDHYPVLYANKLDRNAHEFILDIRKIKERTGISEEDIAKRLMDYNFHGPTMSFPVPGTLMVEPTESESLAELDRFADSLIQIKVEIEKVASGEYDKVDNPLKNAPHTLSNVVNSKWNRKYTVDEAAYPLPWLRNIGKIWPTVNRINNVQSEKNLMFEYPDN